MTRLWMAGLHLAELFVSSLVHLLYGLYIFSTAVAGDLSQALNESLFKSNVNVGVKEEEPKGSTSAADLPPIVLVHGIFGFGKGRLGGLSYFAGAEKKDERVFVPDLGSLTSIYDRACELFYYLKGGQVDYGEEHSKACGHSRFGRIYEQGHYPEWDEDHPIHFVGHSAGAQVVRVLQQMLADKAFSGHENTSENWVLSVTSLSGAFNGTTRTYLDGMQPEDGRSLKPISLLQLCRLGLRVYDWLDVPWLKNYYNFGFDHFNMSWKKRGVRGFVDCLLGNSGPFASGDWILPDLTIQGSMRLNSHLQTFPNTYYFSYATKRTRKIMGVTVPSSIPGIHPLLFLRVLQMSQWRLPQDTKPPYKGYRDEDWWDNDGALNTISMTHPRLPVEHPSQLVVKDSDCQPMQPGIWGVIGGDDTNQDYVVGEEEAVWLVKMILPYLNEFLLKFRALFYGDPATTMKLAIMLFVLARFGSTITIWKMAKLGFFGVFSLPKICSSYSTLITAYEHGEGLQILHYEVGQKYEPHFDYFADEFNTKNGGQRIATVLMYLSDVEEGGETVFPAPKGNYSSVPWWNELSECGKGGLSVKPKMGDALLFWSMKPDATLDPSSLHGGCPVIKGNKWSSTKWMRVNEYKV